jgi:L-aspartate oxidase
VGIVREEERLTVARDRLATLARDAEHYAEVHTLEPDLAELRNLTLLGDLIIRSASFRRESRGLHAMLEYPERDDAFAGDTLQRSDRDEPWLLPLRARGFGVREWTVASETSE